MYFVIQDHNFLRLKHVSFFWQIKEIKYRYQFTSIGTCLSAAFVHLRLFLQLDEMSRVISFINDFGSVFFLYGSVTLKFITTIYCIF